MLTLDENDKLLMIPGPTPVQRDILAAMAEPTISHTSAAIAAIVRRCQDGVRQVAGTAGAHVFIFGGSGTLAQEAAVINLVAPGQRLLVVSNGFFGDRFVPMAEAHGIEVERLAAPWGRSVTPEELDERLSGGDFAAVTVTMVETSTGVLAPVAELAAVARRHGVRAIVDAVCALAGVPISMDDWGIDIVLSAAQKALGVPPGLSILAVSGAALEHRRSLGRIGSYYADLLNWESSMENPQQYFSTHAVNLFFALQEGVQIIKQEGLEARFARHNVLGRSFRAGLKALGFGSLTEEPFLAPTLSVALYPDGLDDAQFLATLSKKGVVAAGCLGEFRGRGARFGHMGNITQGEVLTALAAIEQTMRDLEVEVETGAGVAAAQRVAAEGHGAGRADTQAEAAGTEAPQRAP